MSISKAMIADLKRPNFKPHEFFVSTTADKLGLNNSTDNVNILVNLDVLADKAQEIRNLLAFPMTISSAYRSPKVNSEVGGETDSQHLDGEAMDFVCPKFGTPAQIVDFLKSQEIEVDQCIIERSGKSRWVHLSIKLTDNRNQFASLFDGVFKIIA